MFADVRMAFWLGYIQACQNVLHGLISASPMTFTSSGMASYVCSICAWPIVSGSAGFSVLPEKLQAAIVMADTAKTVLIAYFIFFPLGGRLNFRRPMIVYAKAVSRVCAVRLDSSFCISAALFTSSGVQ